jgi:hypothetical protein
MGKSKGCPWCGSTQIHSCPGPRLGQWIDLNLPLGPIYKKDLIGEFDTVSKYKILRPGVLLEFDLDKKGAKEYFGNDGLVLVGHMNDKCGVCDDCRIPKEFIVKRYKVVWERE